MAFAANAYRSPYIWEVDQTQIKLLKQSIYQQKLAYDQRPMLYRFSNPALRDFF